jgi:hypothetical protein
MDTNQNGNAEDRGHEIIGSRVTVYHVYEYLVGGWTKSQILDVLPITSEQYDRALQYIAEHRSQVEEVHRQIEERNARGNPPEIRAKLEESHRRFEAWKAKFLSAKASEETHAGDSRRR